MSAQTKEKESRISSAPPSHQNVCAVIVTYNPDSGFKERLRKVVRTIPHVIIVDNSDTDAGREFVASLSGGVVEVVSNQKNTGLAAALVAGFRLAMSGSYVWALALDDDSTIDDDLLSDYEHIYSAHARPERIGIIATNYRSSTTHATVLRLRQDKRYSETLAVITSGSLHSLAVYTELGVFREDFFIEGIDTEYCLRLRKNGYVVLLAHTPHMTHTTGKMIPKSFFGKNIYVDNHAPIRYYYNFRNCTINTRLYFNTARGFFFRTFLNYGKILFKVLFYEDNKYAKFVSMAKGVRDGIRYKHFPDA